MNTPVITTSPGPFPTNEETVYNRFLEEVILQHPKYKKELLKNPLIDFTVDKDRLIGYDLTPSGKMCEFLTFLVNSSNFTWNRPDATAKEKNLNNYILLSKLCAIGYLLIREKHHAKAVVAVNGNYSSEGSGKTLFAQAIAHCVEHVWIRRKGFNENNPFQLQDVTASTRAIIIDDPRSDFQFGSLNFYVTGDYVVNRKGKPGLLIPFDLSPKICITTNEMIFISQPIRYLLWIIQFSDFYDKPKDMFHNWTYAQWNLFLNLMANCVQLYLRFGFTEVS